MGMFSWIFKAIQGKNRSEAGFDNPIQMAEDNIRDLKDNLREAMASLAQVKSVAIRLHNDTEDQRSLAASHERKAMLALQEMQNGQLDAAEAERRAQKALEHQQAALERAAGLQKDYEAQQVVADRLQLEVGKLQREITRYENELVTLRARSRTAESMQKINKQIAGVESTSTLDVLERMKERVVEQESLANAYGQLADLEREVNAEPSDPVAPKPPSGSESLEALKRRMGIAT